MDIIYKVLAGVISALVLMFGGYAIIIALSTEISVNNYFETVTQTIVESDYNEDVIATCIENADSYGYELSVEVHGTDVYGVKKYADIRLKYTSELRLFGISIDKEKQKVI